MVFFKLTLKEQMGEREWSYTFLIEGDNEKIVREKVQQYVLNFHGEIEDNEDIPEINEESNTLDFGDVFLTWSLEKTTKGEFIEELLERYTLCPEN